MALERDKLSIGIASGAKTSERFRTDLPDIGAGIQTAANALMAGYREEEERALKTGADEAVRAAVGSTIIGKDEQGNYILPTAPANFGPYAKQLFEVGTQQLYQNHIINDVQTELNTIQANHQNDPETAKRKIREVLDRTTAQTHPTQRGPLAPQFLREANQRIAPLELRSEQFKFEAEKRRISEEYAGTAIATKDNDGNWILPQPPANLNKEQKEAYRLLVQDDFRKKIAVEMQDQLDEIRTTHQHKPEEARRLMTQAIEDKVKTLPAAEQNVLRRALMTQFVQRQGPIKQRDEEFIYRTKAEKEGAEWAGRQVIQEDENGNFLMPKVPPELSKEAAVTANRVLEANYLNGIQQRVETRLDRIMVDNELNPEKAKQEMLAYMEGVSRGVDPKFSGVIQNFLTKELRDRSTKLELAYNHRTNQIEGVKLGETITRLRSEAQDAFAAGDEQRGHELIEQMKNSQRRLEGLQQRAPDPAGEERINTDIKANGQILQTLRQKIADTNPETRVTEENLGTLRRILDGTSAEGENVWGYDRKWVDDNLKTPAMRHQLMAQLARAEAELKQRISKESSEVTFNSWFAPYRDGNVKGPTGNITGEVETQLFEMWAARTIDPATGRPVDFYSPTGTGLQAAINQFGYIPKKIQEHAFAGAVNFTEKRAVAMWEFYNNANNMSSLSGGGTVSMTKGNIRPEDDHFMTKFGEGYRANGGNATGAIEYAKQAMKNRALIEGGNASFIVRQHQSTAADSTFDQTKLEKRYTDALQKNVPAMGGSFAFGFGTAKLGFGDLPQQAKEDIHAMTAMRMSFQGAELESAVDWATKRFNETWLQDKRVMGQQGKGGGWTREEAWPKPVIGPTGQKSDAYIDHYVNAAAKADIWSIPSMGGNQKIPADAALGKDIFLIPVGNGRHNVYYSRDGDPTNSFPIIDNKNQQAVIIDLTTARRKQAQAMGDNDVDRARQIRTNARTPPTESTMEGVVPSQPDTGPKPLRDSWAPADVRDILIDRPDLKGIPGAVPPLTARQEVTPRRPLADDPLRMPTTPAPERRPNVTLPQIRGAHFLQDVHPDTQGVIAQVAAQDDFRNLRITEGRRGGSGDSQHLAKHDYRAVDIDISGLTQYQKGQLIDALMDDPRVNGLGAYNESSIHVDTRVSGPRYAWGPNKSIATIHLAPAWFRDRVLDPDRAWAKNVDYRRFGRRA
jgi:hypothetical protein